MQSGRSYIKDSEVFFKENQKLRFPSRKCHFINRGSTWSFDNDGVGG